MNSAFKLARFLMIGYGLVTPVLALAGKPQPIVSQWRETPIVIDGDKGDWPDLQLDLEKKECSIGVSNDADFLYLALRLDNPLLVRQLLRRGFTVWFNPAGNRKKTFGIRYPVGARGGPRGRQSRAVRGDGAPQREDGADPETNYRQRMESMLRDVEIIIPALDMSRRIPLQHAPGIEVQIKGLGDEVFYELKLPLVKKEGFPYAAGMENGVLGVGFLMPKPDQARRQRGGFGRGRGGPGGGRGGFGARSNGGGGVELKVWTRVAVASEPSPPVQPN